MSFSVSIKSDCRLCGSNDLSLIVPIGKSPVSEKYSLDAQISSYDELVPLDLYICGDCGHVQLIHVVDPEFLWDDFTFETGRNPVLVQHFKEYADSANQMVSFSDGSLVVDIGSNDGTALRCFKELGYKVLGVDPAKDIADRATKSGIETIPDFMDTYTANKLINEYGHAKIVTANNVYAHVDNLAGLTDDIRLILDADGIFIFEVSYLLDVIDNLLLGTIFHEHLCYHSVKPLARFLDKHELELIQVKRAPVQGGSIICYAQHKGGPYQIDGSVEKIIKMETNRKLDKKEGIIGFSDKLKGYKDKVNSVVKKIEPNNKTLAGFGSARSGTTLLNYFNIADKISYIVDDNEDKHYKYTSGNKIKVLPTDTIYNDKPDYLLILAWIHAEKIISNHAKYIEQGGSFIRIFPNVEIVN